MNKTEFEKRFYRRRLLSLIIAAGYSLLGGIEYIVILPTAWNYLQTLGVTEEYWLGFTVSVYSFVAAISGVLVGRLADMYTTHTKMMVVISIIVRAIGNYQYTLGINIWNILCSRLISGIGTGAGTALLAEICRTTTTEERTPILSINSAMSELGILIGPAFQLALSYFSFTIWGFEVNPLNAPGVFTGLLWTIYLVVTVLFFYNLAEDFRIVNKKRKEGTDATSTAEVASFSNERIIASSSDSGCRQTGTDEPMEASVTAGATYKQYVEEFMTDTFILLMSMAFILNFCITGIETAIPIITQEYFGYGVFENSLIYMAGGLQSVTLFFVIGALGKYVRDTTMQIIGFTFMLFALVWLMVFIPTFSEGSVSNVVKFMVGIMTMYLGLPIGFVSSTGLISKVLSDETQGLGQGLGRLAMFFGVIYGPSWAGSTVKQPYLYFGSSIAIALVNAVMLACSYKHLRRAEDLFQSRTRKRASSVSSCVSNNSLIADDESTPLIPNRPA